MMSTTKKIKHGQLRFHLIMMKHLNSTCVEVNMNLKNKVCLKKEIANYQEEVVSFQAIIQTVTILLKDPK